MKHILTLLLVNLLAFTTLSAKADHSISFDDEYVFTIHVGAFVKAKMSDFKEIRPYGFLYAQQYNNLLQIYMGDYPTEPQAMKVLERIKRHGYADAFVTRRNMEKGKSVRVIQVASSAIGEDIDWLKYSAAGQLYAVLDDNQVKLVTGPFQSSDEANNYLNSLKQIGFSSAFTRRINNVLLHKITAFEAGQELNFPSQIIVPQESVQEEVIAESAVEDTPPAPVPSMIVKKRPKKKIVLSEPVESKEVLTAREVVPESFDVIVKKERITPKPNVEERPTAKEKPAARATPAKPTATTAKAITIPLPAIRAKVKRTSALELQKVLKSEAVYSNSLDGFYGTGTAKGWEAIKKSHPQLKKYILLATQEETLRPKGTTDVLQHYINTLYSSPEKSLTGLTTSKEAIAKAYRAYYLFNQNGPSKSVNDLMNSAIKQAFSNKKMENKPKFDYTAAYDYNDIGQLILHLRYVQGASNPEPELPAWMFAKHPKEVTTAFEKHSSPTDNNYKVQSYNEFMDWEEINLLKTVLADLNTNTDKDAQKQQEANNNTASRILWRAKALNLEDRKNIFEWNKTFWTKMETWAANDPLHQKFLTPLKVTYFQSWVRLEDHFMDKGVSPQDAKGLALTVLKNMVEVPLGNM